MSANNKMVCHAWAHNQNRFFNGANLSRTETGILRSYSTCIGQRMEIDDKIVFLVDTTRYSNATSKHQAYMLDAIPTKDDNVYVFEVPAAKYERSWLVWMHCNDRGYNDLVCIGLQMLIKELINCISVKDCTKLEHGFTYNGYNEMVRLFEVTGATTVQDILEAPNFDAIAESAIKSVQCDYTKVDKVRESLKKFMTLMSENASIADIVDAINGEGTWEAYQKRTARLRVAERNRKLSHFVGCYLQGASCTSITQKEIAQHTKSGDLVAWLFDIRRKNFLASAEAKEKDSRTCHVQYAMRRLEKHLGMNGWGRYSWFDADSRVRSFCYNGTTVDFTGSEAYIYRERNLSEEEYQEFVNAENKAEWITNKRQWMLEQLLGDVQRHNEMEAEEAKEKHYAALEEKRRNELALRQEYIDGLKAQGDAGIRQLYHEGYTVKLPADNAEVYYGGNTLLKVNTIRKVVETSKGVSLKFAECKRLWKLVQRWYNRTEECRKGLEIKTIGADYTVHSFQNNILTAGCHQISYNEMAYIAKELNF